MGKLGKKARKFAKKNLQSVLRRKRKTKALFKKKSSSKDDQDNVENEVENTTNIFNGRNTDGGGIEDTSLDAVFTDSDVEADASDSDGYLSEDSSCPHVAESETVNDFEDNRGISTLSKHNRKIHEELVIQKKKLDRIKNKDPEFVKFLRSYNKGEVSEIEEMYSDEDEKSNHVMQLVDEDESTTNKGKLVTSSVINSWCQRVTEDHSESALISLLNAYRAACHFGTESTGLSDTASCYRIQNSETFCNVLTFVLREADNIFRGQLKLSSSSCKKETILELKNTSKWKKLKPLLKSYLRSTLFLLNQVTNSDILALSLTRLRASIVFFAAFPSLLQILIKISVHLWATSGGALSSCSFLIIRDVAVVFGSSCFDTCLKKAYKAYIARCRVIEFVDIRHIEFLKNSFVELCSLDMQKSCSKALLSIQQLAKILQQGLRTKRKVEQNVEFVQKKRDEVAFSPKDHQNVESFLQLEKGSLNSPFTQYYKSVMEKAAARNLHMNEKISLLKQKNLEKGQLPNNMVDAVKGDPEKRYLSVGGGTIDSKRKKRRVLKA